MGIRPIERLLIANRGEIACRIARTAHRLGVSTVGVYSEVDRSALHVDSVDLAVALGGRTPAESYLRADAVIEAALATGCDAVHPGYGFLAENAELAGAVIDASLVWVGPSPRQIALLGDKIAAKEAAVAAGVATTEVQVVAPGSIQSGLTMPVVVKAAAGGGGRGMRVVRAAPELADAVVSAAREAHSAFGDPTVFVEPFIEGGRHVEVQIIGDAHGNVIHLGERECSIQRRHQKIVEEAPSPGIDPDVRAVLHESALALARHIGYQNAGTVEFLVGPDGRATFLEVNARLQVEHPVTEAVTGLDLVELQLVVASGAELPIGQDDVAISGHAIEARLVAEDPAAGWLPTAGEITDFAVDPSVRTDTGVRVGTVVSSDYDSLLAKVVAHGADREAARRQLVRAVRTARVAGLRTNADTLVSILGETDFVAGHTTTDYLAEHPDVLAGLRPTGDDHLAHLLAVVLGAQHANRRRDRRWGFAPSGWRNLRTQGQRRTWVDMSGGNEAEHQVEYVMTSASSADVLVGAWPEPGPDGSLTPDDRRRATVRVGHRDDGSVAVDVDSRRRVVHLSGVGNTVSASDPSGRTAWRAKPRFVDHADEIVGGGPIAPLPGTVIAVHVNPGDRVEAGQTLLVLEAMKMEHQIVAPVAATVTEVAVGVGDRVDMGDRLVGLEPDE